MPETRFLEQKLHTVHIKWFIWSAGRHLFNPLNASCWRKMFLGWIQRVTLEKPHLSLYLSFLFSQMEITAPHISEVCWDQWVKTESKTWMNSMSIFDVSKCYCLRVGSMLSRWRMAPPSHSEAQRIPLVPAHPSSESISICHPLPQRLV